MADPGGGPRGGGRVGAGRRARATAPRIAPARIQEGADELMVVQRRRSGVRLRRFASGSDEFLRAGAVLSNAEIVAKFRVGTMGGIRYSHRCNALLLFMTRSGPYEDRIDPDGRRVEYSGEGSGGDQRDARGNRRIIESGGSPVLLFRDAPAGQGAARGGFMHKRYEFVGCVRYAGHRWAERAGGGGRSAPAAGGGGP